MLSFIIPHIFLTYAILIALSGCHYVAVVITSCLVGALYCCKLPKSSVVDADEILQPRKVSVIAHRGAGHDAPENTLAAMRESKKNGADAIEFDVDYTLDGVPVVIHDDTVDRTTDGTGRVNHLTFGQIQKLSASAKHHKSDMYPNERIPTLDEMVALGLSLGLKMYIDVKGSAKQSADALPDLYKKYPALYDHAIVCSFHPQIVYMVKRRDPRIVTALTHRTNYLTRKVDGTEREGPFYQRLLCPVLDILLQWALYNWLWYLCGTSAFLANIGDMSKSMVEHYRKRGIQVIAWTVNSTHDKNYMMHSLKCSYITDTMLTEGCQPQTN